jgi:hypothetical protein
MQMTYYRAQIRIADTQTKVRPQVVKPSLGMTGTADIHVGSRTVLSYMAKPILKSLSTAMTER